MRLGKQDSVLLAAPDIETLKGFVDALNTKVFPFIVPGESGWRRVLKDYQPVQWELRRLARAWLDSGPNIVKLFSADPILAQASLSVRAHLIPTKGGRAHLTCVTVPDNLAPGDPLEIAMGLFLDFLVNPTNERLGGPCKHCNKYYVKKTKRQIVYCSKQCGLKHTSQTAIRKQRQREHLENLEKAKRSSAKWAKTKTSKDWKDWINRETRIGKSFLTRAVRKGELVEPVKMN